MRQMTSKQRAALGRLARDLHGSSIETTVTDDGQLLTDFRAIGHRFRFRFDTQGTVVERSCMSERKLALTLSSTEFLTDDQRAVLTRALQCYEEDALTRCETPAHASAVSDEIEAIALKLGVSA
jgi:hypothetical protein